GRGGQGVIALQITDRNGIMVGALQVSLDDAIMLMSQNGVLVRTPVKDISVVGRNTQGVRLIRLEEGDQLSGLERIEGLAGEGEDAEPAPQGPPPPRCAPRRRFIRPEDARLQFLAGTCRFAAGGSREGAR